MKNENIPVVILAGGFGTRLREQTEFMPKPMLPVGGKPVLWHIMKIYSNYGFRRFIICLGYKGETIKDFFYNYKMRTQDFTINLSGPERIKFHSLHKEEDWEVTLADTGIRAMTGARINKIERYIDTDLFLMTYGDGVSDVRIDKVVDFHLSHHKAATVTGVKPPSRFGELIVDKNCVIEFSEKPQVGTGLINGGFFVFNRGVFEFLSSDDDCMFEKEPMENLAKTGNLMVYQHDGFWQCMDTLRDMNYLNELWESGSPPWQVWKD
jgi:glucose-1-phosphate cytidylyltransferase